MRRGIAASKMCTILGISVYDKYVPGKHFKVKNCPTTVFSNNNHSFLETNKNKSR